MNVLTCSGLSHKASWDHLIRPCDAISWIALCLSLCSIYAVSLLFSRKRILTNRLPEAFVLSLLEHSFKIKRQITEGSAFPFLIGAFVLAGIVLSNGYKGIVTTSVVKPFERARIRSLETVLELNYRLLMNATGRKSTADLRRYCCGTKEGLTLKMNMTRFDLSMNMCHLWNVVTFSAFRRNTFFSPIHNASQSAALF